MRLARVGQAGAERAVASNGDDVWHDISSVVGELDPAAIERLASGDAADLVTRLDDLPVVEPDRFGPPLSAPGKIICIGLNYRDHAAESGAAIPGEPIVFLKTPDTVIGPDDEVLVPRTSVKTDWEVELAVVIGREARYLDSPADSLAHVAGYAISNDVSERAFQLERGGQWDKGKNCETFNPFGPWITTADEIGDPQRLGLKLSVNGQLRQDGSTADMIFAVDHVVWYLSQFMVLRPGDVINTGTPAGVAMGIEGQPYLRPGDVMELSIDGLGRQRQTVGAA